MINTKKRTNLTAKKGQIIQIDSSDALFGSKLCMSQVTTNGTFCYISVNIYPRGNKAASLFDCQSSVSLSIVWRIESLVNNQSSYICLLFMCVGTRSPWSWTTQAKLIETASSQMKSDDKAVLSLSCSHCWCKHEAMCSFISAEHFQHENKLLVHDYMQLLNVAKFSKQNCEKQDILLVYFLNCPKGARLMFVVSSGLCLACFRWNLHRQDNPTLMINKCFDRNATNFKREL